MKSAMRTVLNRCETRIVMRPSAAGWRAPAMPPCAAAASRSNKARPVSASAAEVGLWSVREQRRFAHESSGKSKLLPLPEADLDSVGPGGPELSIEARYELCDDVDRAGAIDGPHHGRNVVETRQVTDANRVAGPEFESEEILK